MLAGGFALLLVLGVVLAVSMSASRQPIAPRSPALAAVRIPAAESGLLPWRLGGPISREVVLPGNGSQLVLLGGLGKGTSSTGGVFSLDTAAGALRAIGSLPAGVHDAVGAIVGGQDMIFGGGSPTTVGSVVALPTSSAASRSSTPGASAGPASRTATVVGLLPLPRSDAGLASIANTTYIVGGYDGTKPDPIVLSTTDGRTFRPVVSLRVPVRYPAVAALAGKLYVFGGEAISGPGAGSAVDDIQVVDPATRKSWVAGRLPEPLEGATAVTLGGHVYVAGGVGTTPQTPTPGLGSTQIVPAAPGTKPRAGTFTVSTIWAFDPAADHVLAAGRLQVPVSYAGVAVLGSRAWIVGGESNGAQLSTVQMITPNARFGTAGALGAGSPYFGGKLLVADRANDRLILLDPSMHIVWRFPSASSPPDSLGFYFPDDAFFVGKGAAILSNQEGNETIQEIAYPTGKISWSYGHPRQAGSAPGYLHEPDDAYLLKDGQITVADAQSCRVLVINPNRTVAHQIGTAGSCMHGPPASLGSPNGDTPLADGNLLISEINGSWVSEQTPSGHLIWGVQLPISYPSDPQQLGPDLYLIADYAQPGQVLVFNRAAQILYRYDVTSGPGMLDHPSLAERLPSGVIMINDDYRDRMVAIDLATRALVWQYGITGRAGTAPGMLNTPDGFDLLMDNGSTPTHPATG